MENFLTFQAIYSMEHLAARGAAIRVADNAGIAGQCFVLISTAWLISSVLDAILFCLATEAGAVKVSISNKVKVNLRVLGLVHFWSYKSESFPLSVK